MLQQGNLGTSMSKWRQFLVNNLIFTDTADKDINDYAFQLLVEFCTHKLSLMTKIENENTLLSNKNRELQRKLHELCVTKASNENSIPLKITKITQMMESSEEEVRKLKLVNAKLEQKLLEYELKELKWNKSIEELQSSE